MTVQVSYDEDGCYSKNDYFTEDNKYQLYLEVTRSVCVVSDKLIFPVPLVFKVHVSGRHDSGRLWTDW